MELYTYEVIVDARYRVRVKAENDEQACEIALDEFEDGVIIKKECSVGSITAYENSDSIVKIEETK